MFTEKDRHDRKRRVWAFKGNAWVEEVKPEPFIARFFEHPNRVMIQNRNSIKRRAA